MKPRSLVFDIFGNYVRYRGGEIGLAELTKLLGVFDVAEETARVTLSRMRSEGWLETRRAGRKAYYALSDRSWRVLDEGRLRIFDRRPYEWDGSWRLVLYKVPESHREARDRIRKELLWLGFGRVAPQVWISPRDRFNDLQRVFSENGLTSDAFMFVARSPDLKRDKMLATQCWDLRSLDRAYRVFIARWERELAHHRKKRWPDERVFKERTRLVTEYRKFPFSDPDLPDVLQPPGWIGRAAHKLFLRAYDVLGKPSWRFFDSVVSQPSDCRKQPKPG